MKWSKLPSSLWHLLIILWAVAFAFLLLNLMGTNTIFSHLVGHDALPIAVEISFFALSGIFALLLWRFFPRPQTVFAWLCAFLPPILIFIIFLA